MALWLAHHFPTLIVWYHQRKRKKEHYGFKLIIGQVKKPHNFIQSLYNKGFIIIDLQRRQVWYTALSAAMAVSSGQWYVNNSDKRNNDPIIINPNLLFSRLNHTILQNKIQSEITANKKTISVVYETDLLDEYKQSVFAKRICNELHVPVEPLKGASIKTHERPLEERITNYPELVKLTQESEFARHLNQ